MLDSVAAEVAHLPPLNMIRMMAHGGELFAPWRELGAALLNDSQLPPLLRELAILRVAALSPGADYEREQHEAIARQLGMSEELVELAHSGVGLSGDEALVAAFVEQVVREVAPNEQTWKMVAARFTPREIVELLTVIGHYMAVARVGATLRIDADPPVGTVLFDAMRDAGAPVGD